MAGRQTLTIPFGGGIDRATGVAVLESTAFSDLRNVHLRRGRATLRKGLTQTVQAAGDDALLAVAPIRSQGIGAIITWRAADRTVRLSLVSGDGSTLSFVDVLWTLPANAAQRVSVTDSYGKLFVAHDEAVFARRQNTKVYDYATGSVSDYVADLYKPNDPDGDGIGADPVPVKFRRVLRYLNYLVGLGYGTEVVAGENDGEDDRPEIVRVSLPGQPTVLLPESYFIAGQRGEPALTGQPTQGGLLVLKDADSYRIQGTDAETFGIFPADPDYGVAGSELAVNVGGICYFWSLHGPRASSGGASEDLSVPLDLDGPLPDILAGAVDVSDGFATYDPVRQEVLFVFGRWAYVLHLAEPAARRWSYREYGVDLGCAGLLYLTGSPVIGPNATPEITSVTGDAAVDGQSSPVTVTWNTVGALAGGETYEIWGKAASDGVWQKLGSGTVADAGGTAQVDALPGVDYAIAMRYKLNGVAGAGFTAADPATWPAAAQGATTTTLAVPVLSDGTWERTDAATEGLHLAWAPAYLGLTLDINGVSHDSSYVTQHMQLSTDGGATWEELSNAHEELAAILRTIVGHGEQAVQVRMRHESVYAVGDWSNVLDAYVGPPAPTDCVIVIDGIPVGNYSVEWTNAISANTEVWIREDVGGAFALDGTAAPDFFDQNVARPCPASFTELYAEVRHKLTQFGVDDFSEMSAISPASPPNC